MKITSSLALIMCLSGSALPASAQDRVRVTTEDVVEMPGVVRIDARTTSAEIVSSDDESITVKDAAGGVMTLARPNHRIVGLVTAVNNTTITLARNKGSEMQIPRAAIRYVERTNGQLSRKRYVLLGLATGVTVGATIGYISGKSRRCAGFLAPRGSPANQSCFLEPAASTALGAIFGGSAGAVIGAFVPRQDRWVRGPAF